MATGTVLLPVSGAILDPTNPPQYNTEAGAPKQLFDADAREYLYWIFRFPSDIDVATDPVLKIQYAMASATTGNVVWGCQIMAVTPGTDNQNIDVDSFDTENTDSIAVPAVAGYPSELSLTLTNRDNLAAGDYFKAKFGRVATDGSDTATGDAELIAASIEYTIAAV